MVQYQLVGSCFFGLCKKLGFYFQWMRIWPQPPSRWQILIAHERKYRTNNWSCYRPEDLKCRLLVCMRVCALRASNYAICGLAMIFACISDYSFSDWFAVDSDIFSRGPYHGLAHVTAFSDNAQNFKYCYYWCCFLSRFVTVCHGLLRNC